MSAKHLDLTTLIRGTAFVYRSTHSTFGTTIEVTQNRTLHCKCLHKIWIGIKRPPRAHIYLYDFCIESAEWRQFDEYSFCSLFLFYLLFLYRDWTRIFYPVWLISRLYNIRSKNDKQNDRLYILMFCIHSNGNGQHFRRSMNEYNQAQSHLIRHSTLGWIFRTQIEYTPNLNSQIWKSNNFEWAEIRQQLKEKKET